MFDQLAIFSRRRDPRARAPPERSFRITNERARIQAGKFFVSLPPAIHSTSSVLLRRKLAAAQNSSLIATIVSQRAQFMRRLPHPPPPAPPLPPPPPPTPGSPTRIYCAFATSEPPHPLPRRYRYHRLSARIGAGCCCPPPPIPPPLALALSLPTTHSAIPRRHRVLPLPFPALLPLPPLIYDGRESELTGGNLNDRTENSNDDSPGACP